MKRKTAALAFLVVCLAIAALLLTGVITTITSGIIIAIALVVFGGLSKGFSKDVSNNKPAA